MSKTLSELIEEFEGEFRKIGQKQTCLDILSILTRYGDKEAIKRIREYVEAQCMNG